MFAFIVVLKGLTEVISYTHVCFHCFIDGAYRGHILYPCLLPLLSCLLKVDLVELGGVTSTSLTGSLASSVGEALRKNSKTQNNSLSDRFLFMDTFLGCCWLSVDTLAPPPALNSQILDQGVACDQELVISRN